MLNVIGGSYSFKMNITGIDTYKIDLSLVDEITAEDDSVLVKFKNGTYTSYNKIKIG